MNKLLCSIWINIIVCYLNGEVINLWHQGECRSAFGVGQFRFLILYAGKWSTEMLFYFGNSISIHFLEPLCISANSKYNNNNIISFNFIVHLWESGKHSSIVNILCIYYYLVLLLQKHPVAEHQLENSWYEACKVNIISLQYNRNTAALLWVTWPGNQRAIHLDLLWAIEGER